MRFVGRAIAVAFSLLVAIAAGAAALFAAALFDPVASRFAADILWVGLWHLFDSLIAVEEPDLILNDTVSGLRHFVAAILIAPPTAVALAAEVMGWRGLSWHAGATAMLTAAIPWLMQDSARPASAQEIHLTIVLALAGAAAGLCHWLIAGRSAGIGPSPPKVRLDEEEQERG